jgi:hypothetical protein
MIKGSQLAGQAWNQVALVGCFSRQSRLFNPLLILIIFFF